MSDAPRVIAVNRSETHTFSKSPCSEVELVAGIGVRTDTHAGAQVKHRSRVKVDPTQPNLRQVHMIHTELFAQVAGNGFTVGPGELGENLTTAGIDLLGLPVGAVLRVGQDALLALTGLRNPCVQIDRFQPGLLADVSKRNEDGSVSRLAGVMSVVVAGGIVRPGDAIQVSLPPPPRRRLEPV